MSEVLDMSITKRLVEDAVCAGEMDQVWKAIRSELDADLTIEYKGGPVQVRFGDYISESIKRIPLSRIVSELIEFMDGEELDYYIAIAGALEKQSKRIMRAIARAQRHKKIERRRSSGN